MAPSKQHAPISYLQTIGDLVELVFPLGTNPLDQDEASTEAEDKELDHPWAAAPIYAADVFAFCAYLINHIGGMGYFDPAAPVTKNPTGQDPLEIGLSPDQRAACRIAAEEWKATGTTPRLVHELWGQINASWEEVASIFLYRAKAPQYPIWWEAAFSLLIIADEACEGIGHYIFDADGCIDAKNARCLPSTFENRTIDAKYAMYRLSNSERWETKKNKPPQARKNYLTMGVMANAAVISVQPKGRVTSVGSSLRNMTRNLAAVGPVGAVRCNWQQLASPCAPGDGKMLNILLIPAPYTLRGSDFVPKAANRFEIKQSWLAHEDAFCEDMRRLVEHAVREGPVHGIVFPEYALNFPVFDKLRNSLFDAADGQLKFMIAGTSSNCEANTGNFVMTAIWEGTGGKERVRFFSQRKHQRWRLDPSQIATYALGSSLVPSQDWWEDHKIGRRELHFFQLAEDAVFTSLICEDMARNDPCHDIIRSVAPNLVFALLMDGPQLSHRWPARYAGALADDPGCAVLSFTSYGLITRSNYQWGGPSTHAVSLLRDSNGVTKEIALPAGQDAVIVTLRSEQAGDRTFDGRATRFASQWSFVSQLPIGIGLRKG
jgi:hypothetical protein